MTRTLPIGAFRRSHVSADEPRNAGEALLRMDRAAADDVELVVFPKAYRPLAMAHRRTCAIQNIVYAVAVQNIPCGRRGRHWDLRRRSSVSPPRQTASGCDFKRLAHLLLGGKDLMPRPYQTLPSVWRWRRPAIDRTLARYEWREAADHE